MYVCSNGESSDLVFANFSNEKNWENGKTNEQKFGLRLNSTWSAAVQKRREQAQIFVIIEASDVMETQTKYGPNVAETVS